MVSIKPAWETHYGFKLQAAAAGFLRSCFTASCVQGNFQPPYENGFYAGCANDCRDYAEGGPLQGWEYEHICAALIHNQWVDKLDVWINRVIFHTVSIFVIFFSRHDIHKEKDYGNFLN